MLTTEDVIVSVCDEYGEGLEATRQKLSVSVAVEVHLDREVKGWELETSRGPGSSTSSKIKREMRNKLKIRCVMKMMVDGKKEKVKVTEFL
jgi:hypothetical protein